MHGMCSSSVAAVAAVAVVLRHSVLLTRIQRA
jgi:hypothetical protein